MSREIDSRTRRRFLTVAGSAATAGLAGCSSLGDSEAPDADEVPDEKFSRPSLTDDAMESLEKTGDIRQVTDAPGVTAYTSGETYEVTDLTKRVEAETLGQFSEPLMVFFAAKANLEGWTTAGATPERVADNSKGIVEHRFNAQGVAETREVESTAPLPDVSSSHSVEFRGTYRTPAVEQTAELTDGETLPIEIPAQDLEIAGLMTVWKQGSGTALMAGGGYPVENYASTTESSVTGDIGSGIDVSVSIDLDLEPKSLRERLNELTEAVS